MSRVRRFKAPIPPIPPSLRRTRRVRKPRFLKNKPVFGRKLPLRATRYRGSRRDPAKHSSDEVWGLVKKMMEGDADAAVVLDDVIEEGVRGTTHFMKIRERDIKRKGQLIPGKVVKNSYAAITPGRSIVLFGINQNARSDYRLRGYTRRFTIGDVAEYDSYNLSYLGKIVQITDKRITFSGERRAQSSDSKQKTRQLSIHEFNWRNWDLNVEETKERNAMISQSI